MVFTIFTMRKEPKKAHFPADVPFGQVCERFIHGAHGVLGHGFKMLVCLVV